MIAGLGNGFGYVTPIATLIRWFPDKRGLVTGLAVMGFGFGAFFMGKIAPGMVNSMGVATTFYILGIIFLILVTAAAQFYKNPPKGWLPAGFTPPKTTASAAQSFTFDEAKKTPQWWMLWAMLCLNISAGLGLLSQLSPMAQEIIGKTQGITDPKALALAGGTILAIASIFNGLGRLFWAWLSDAIGRKNVFMIMFITQAILYILLPQISSQLIFTVIACYLLACYGGGFATMPAFAADSFGPAYIGRVYGIMLTAWSVAGCHRPAGIRPAQGDRPLRGGGASDCGVPHRPGLQAAGAEEGRVNACLGEIASRGSIDPFSRRSQYFAGVMVTTDSPAGSTLAGALFYIQAALSSGIQGNSVLPRGWEEPVSGRYKEGPDA